jgi:hypothetical protein
MCDYIDLDHRTAKFVPKMKGKYSADVVKYAAKLEKKLSKK